MVRIDLEYEQGLHTSAAHGPSGATVATDAPIDNHGRGEAFSPTDLLATSLASCMLTVMGITCEQRDWKLDGARVAVEKHMVTSPVRRVGRLVLAFEMPPGLPEQSREVLERAARTCPVAQSIHPEIVLDVEFAWS
jgi:putative redox protein